MYDLNMKNVIDIGSLKNLEGHYDSMVELIKNLRKDDIARLKETCRKPENDNQYPLSDIKLCTPIEKFDNDIMCLGLNYKEHVEETSRSFKDNSIKVPEYPVYFSKRANKPIGPDDFINSHPNITEQLDYEVELAVIIGKEGSNISKDRAEEYIFGYTIMNDVSARDIQQKHVQWYRGKSLDTFTSFGPCVVYKDEIKFPVELNLYSRVNGELRQNSNTRNFIFDISTIIHELSSGMTLEAGDIIATGTPSGVGMGFNPPKFLKKGDIVECEVENIGVLRNKVV
jgi:2-keto-4-pentenoate hydratase/2-oxohepta-3-ene-1,7-dioic acid hydratase in catechol pathway